MQNIAPNLFFDDDVILITIIDMSKALFLRRIKTKLTWYLAIDKDKRQCILLLHTSKWNEEKLLHTITYV